MAQRIASRCQSVLGFTPEIDRPKPSHGEVVQGLKYNMDKLKKTGFHLTGKFDD